MKTPNPGSKEAVEAGCTCPRIDNCHGKGYHYHEGCAIQFITNEDCPLHGFSDDSDNESGWDNVEATYPPFM